MTVENGATQHVVEAGNRTGLLEALGTATRQTSHLTHARHLVHCCRHNAMVDAKISHLTGRKPRPRDWFVMEALTEDLKQLTRTVVSELHHPPELDLAQHMEPIGELYQLCTHWEDRDREIAALLGNSPAVSTVQQPMSDEFGDFSFLADVDLEEMIS